MQFATSVLALIALGTPLIEAHTRFTTLFVDGESQGDGTCVRMTMDAPTATFPVPDITSTDMTCGVGGLTAVNRTCPVKVGSTVSFKYRSYPDGSQPGVIAIGHSGPCAIYAKKIDSGPVSDSFPTTDPTGDGWFKIMYEDYDGEQWCTNKISTSTDGVISAVIPSDLASGHYLLRPELLALHQAVSLRDPQFYTGCAQVYIDGGSGTAKPETVSIPGYVNYDTPGMKYNLYSQPMVLPYPSYGPTLYKSGSSSKLLAREPEAEATALTSSLSTRDTTSDLTRRNSTSLLGCPDNTILEIGNWCGVEIESYTDTSQAMTNCWAASRQCWAQDQDCWHSFSPAINNDPGHGCTIWNQRCEDINTACENYVMSGPPNQGKVITPARAQLSSMGIEKRDVVDMLVKHRAGKMRRGRRTLA